MKSKCSFFKGDCAACREYDENRKKIAKIRPVEVIFNPPMTIINWSDGSKSKSNAVNGDTFDRNAGFAIAFANRFIDGITISKSDNIKLVERAVEHLEKRSSK